MNPPFRFIQAVTLILTWTACASFAAAPAKTRTAVVPELSTSNSVILVCWDGVGRDIAQSLLKDGKLPNLAALVKAGSFRNIDIKGHLTETLPGHAEMLTGHGPRDTRVSSNFDPGPVPAGLSLFERLETGLGTNAIATLMVTGKSKVATLYDHAEPLMDAVDGGDRFCDEVGAIAAATLTRVADRHFFAFIHFLDPDAAGHRHGSGSAQYTAAIEDCDRWLGLIMDLLQLQALDRKTVLYVTADHGFDAFSRSHHNAPEIWLATNDKTVTRDGLLADIPATILARFGLDLSQLKPPLLGAPLAIQKPTAPAAPTTGTLPLNPLEQRP